MEGGKTQAEVKEKSLLKYYETLLPLVNRLSPSWISLRRILTKILSLAASRGSSLPSAEDQLADRQMTS